MLCALGGFFCFQAEDGIRYLVRSRGLGDVYKRQHEVDADAGSDPRPDPELLGLLRKEAGFARNLAKSCLLYTSDAADERSSVDLGGRRIIKQKNSVISTRRPRPHNHRATIRT